MIDKGREGIIERENGKETRKLIYLRNMNVVVEVEVAAGVGVGVEVEVDQKIEDLDLGRDPEIDQGIEVGVEIETEKEEGANISTRSQNRPTA